MYRLFADTTYNRLKFYNRIVTLKGFIWGIYGGFVIGLLLTFYYKVFLGSVVRKTVAAGALSPESAKTLEELEIKNNFLTRSALKEGKTLRRYVEVANREETVKPVPKKKRGKFLSHLLPDRDKFDYDFSSMKFYVPEDLRETAETRFEQKGKVGVISLIVSIVVLGALAYALSAFALHDILKLLDNFLTMNS